MPSGGMMTISPIKTAFPTPSHPVKKQTPDTAPFAGVFEKLLKTPTRVVAQISKLLPASSSNHASSVRNAALSESLSQHLTRFEEKLKTALKDAGIETDEPLRLEWGTHGAVRAASHSSSAHIEQLFAQDPELQSLFHFVTSTANYLHRGEATTRDFELTLDNGKTGYRFS